MGGFLLPPATQVPVVPDGDEARGWLQDELSKSIYQEARPTLFERLLSKLGEWFAETFENVSSLNPQSGVLILAAASVLVLVVAVVLVRPRLNASRRKKEGLFDQTPARGAVDHRRMSEDAEARGDWNTALAERLRAMIRSAEERVILDREPGQTAAEAGFRLSTAFPRQAESIFWLARRFDEVLYGNLPASSQDCSRARGLDRELEDTRPQLSGPAPARLAAPR